MSDIDAKDWSEAEVASLTAKLKELSASMSRVIIGQADNATAAFVKHWLAWDPDGTLGPTAIARTGVGAYTWSLPGSGTYGDMNGTPIVFQADFAFVNIHGNTDRLVLADVNVDGKSGTINCFLSGAAADIGTAGNFKKFCLVLI